MFKFFLLMLLFVFCAFAAIDSTAVVNGVVVAGQVAQALAQSQGHAEVANIISVIVTAACSIISFIFGHSHGKKSVVK